VLIASAGTPTAYVRAKFAAERELFGAGPVPHSHDVVDMLVATLRFDALRDDDEDVSRWLAMLTQAPAAWTSPDGRLGQLHAEWSWMLDEDRRAGWPAVQVPCLVIAFEHDLDLPPRVGRGRAGHARRASPKSSAPRTAGTSCTRTRSTGS
jgi:pimeloyl-ACP methyl ester carboxylesterase